MASNTTIASIMIPILIDFSLEAKISPLYMVLPAALTTSHAFVLPISTAPMTLVYTRGNITRGQMVLVGSIMTLLTYGTTMLYIIGKANKYPNHFYYFPEWAMNATST